jgi:hypothetical protein
VPTGAWTEVVDEEDAVYYGRPAPILRLLGEMVRDGEQRRRRLQEGREFYKFMSQRKKNASAERSATVGPAAGG